MNSPVHVAAAAIFGADGRLLITRRAADAHQGGLWEFPGGKVEAEETVEKALCRELQEELGIEPTEYQPLIQIPFEYSDKSVLLDVWKVHQFSGEAKAMENQPMSWVSVDELDRQCFPAANRAIIDALQLPDHYMITGDHDGDDQRFLRRCQEAMDQGVAMIQFRSKHLSDERSSALLSKLRLICSEYGCRLIINGSFSLAEKVGADGVHLNGQQLNQLSGDEMAARERNPNWWLGASCHSRLQLEQADSLGVRYLSLSPVLPTATHPDAPTLGWDQFEQLVKSVSVPVYALGGMKPELISEVVQRGGQGVAAIRCYWGEF